MRKTCLNTIYELAKKNKNIVFIGSDLGAGTMDNFKQEMPERFFMEGISESHIIGMASGLAMSGKTVYVNTIAVFITRRCFEQNVIDLGLCRANVRLIGNGGGLVYAPLGPTHLAIEDIAIMRAIPNMTVVVPADATEMRRVILASENYSGPMYIRIAKGGDPVVTDYPHNFSIGKAVVLRAPKDVLFIATGIMVHYVMKAADMLQEKGIRCGILNVHTIKPLDKDTILDAISQCKIVISVEEHVINGGLGSAIAELVAENCWRQSVVFKRVALPDEFTDQYGSQKTLLEHYGLDSESIANTAQQLFKQTIK